jgi:hypothetical protein
MEAEVRETLSNERDWQRGAKVYPAEKVMVDWKSKTKTPLESSAPTVKAAHLVEVS